MIDEPLHIPTVQLLHIERCKQIGFTLVGWVEGEAVIKAADKFFRVMPDGKIQLNIKQKQDKSLQLTPEYSGMYGTGYTTVKQSQQFSDIKKYKKRKVMQKIVRASNTDLLVSS